jgi:hypothetical protein
MSKKFTLSLYQTAAHCLAVGSVEPLRPVFKDREAWARVHSKAKDKGKAYREAWARWDRGERPDVFAEGNGKLPFYAFSSLAGLDCPQAGACLYRDGKEESGPMTGFCYSFKCWRYPDAFMRQLVNSIRLRTEAGRAEIVKAWFALPKGVTVRLYVDGDFASPEILSFWFRLCFARPDLQVYGYSKSWRLILDYANSGGRFPTNYLLNLSSGGSGSEEEKVAVAALPIARGEFIAVQTLKDHGKAYQSRKHAGFGAYQADVKEQSGRKVFVCSGKCGDCTPSGHACGSEKFRGIPIAIGIH